MKTPPHDDALHALLHPITLSAIGLQFLNDHVFRRMAPSPFWGKLGDVTMLIYAPLLFAALLAVFWPGRGPRTRRIVGLAGLGIVGLWFTLGKTVPIVLGATNTLASWITGRPSQLILDPTDLVALPALAVAWWIWQRPSYASPAVGRPFGIAALTLAWLATVATSPPTVEAGIVSICAGPDRVTAFLGYFGYSGGYQSTDGGQHWMPIESDDPTVKDCVIQRESGAAVSTVQVPNSQRLYRLTQAVAIERSDDGGQTWRVIYNAAQDIASAAYVDEVAFGPLHGAIDPVSQNLIVAMGRRGVLLVTPTDEVAWAPMGPYGRSYEPSRDLVGLLRYPLWLAALLVPGVFFAIAVGQVRASPVEAAVGAVMGLSVGVPLLCLAPAASWPEPPTLSGAMVFLQLPLAVTTCLVPVASVLAYRTLSRTTGSRFRWPLMALGFATITAAVFLVPFLLWAFVGYPSFGPGFVFLGPSPAVWLAAILLVSMTLGARHIVVTRVKRGAGATRATPPEETRT